MPIKAINLYPCTHESGKYSCIRIVVYGQGLSHGEISETEVSPGKCPVSLGIQHELCRIPHNWPMYLADASRCLAERSAQLKACSLC